MEDVVLVDELNNQIGTTPKDEVHGTDTPLHRAFSLFIFTDKNQVLLTKRATTKKTFPGVWTNAVCGHPAPGEKLIDAIIRRCHDELGITVKNITEVSPYRYRFVDKNGIVENEICPIFTAVTHEDPVSNSTEVDEWKWMEWKDFMNALDHDDQEIFSPWCKEEANIISRLHAFNR